MHEIKIEIDGLRLVLVSTENELATAKAFRQKYFFDKVNIQDPYIWTFTDPGHAHVVLYKADKIIGCANFEFWDEGRVAMRIIVIDEPYRNLGYGSEFLKICEKWLKTKGYKVLHIESSPTALSFYKKHGYVEMAFNAPSGDETHPDDTPIGKIL